MGAFILSIQRATDPELVEDRDVRVNAVDLRTEANPGAVKRHSTIGRPQSSSDQPEGGAFTSTVQSYQSKTFPGPHHQTETDSIIIIYFYLVLYLP